MVKGMPSISLLPYTADDHVPEHGAATVLTTFGKRWAMEPIYEVRMIPGKIKPIVFGIEPTTFSATVTVGVRKGEGKGSSVAEAKAAAAADCLDQMLSFIPENHRPVYKHPTPTEASKDILYILHGICVDFGFKIPTYTFKQKENKCECVAAIGELSAIGEGDRKRVAIRIAAINIFHKLRKLHNQNRLPDSVKIVRNSNTTENSSE